LKFNIYLKKEFAVRHFLEKTFGLLKNKKRTSPTHQFFNQ